MNYRAVVFDSLPQLPQQALPKLQQLATAGRLIMFGESPYRQQLSGVRVATSADQLLVALNALAAPDVVLAPPSIDIRVRHVIKGGRHFYLLFNEQTQNVVTHVELAVPGPWQWWDPQTSNILDVGDDHHVDFAPHEMKLLCVKPADQGTGAE